MTAVAWKHQIARWDRVSLWDEVLLADGAYWYVKPDCRADLLAFRLGGAFLNIAEVREAPDAGAGAVMVRLGQTYRRAELPLHDLDEAVAGELAFSLWVRRRDTHACNRVYVEGIPLFFDHHVAFGLHDEEDRTLDGFMRDGPDRGYVTRWRVREIDPEVVPSTDSVREWCRREWLAIHAVRSTERFRAALDRWCDRIVLMARDGARVEELVRSTLPDPASADAACALLSESADELPRAVERVSRFLTS